MYNTRRTRPLTRTEMAVCENRASTDTLPSRYRMEEKRGEREKGRKRKKRMQRGEREKKDAMKSESTKMLLLGP
jgi:hypothetical protein